MKPLTLVSLLLGPIVAQVAQAQSLRFIENFLVYNASRDGSVLVGADQNFSAVRWTASGQTVMYLGDGVTSYGLGQVVSSDGNVVGGMYVDAQNQTRLYRWSTSTGFQSLGNAGTLSLEPRGITDDGQTMVGTYGVGGGSGAFRWTPGEGIRALPLGFGGEAVAISADGRTYAGSRQVSGVRTGAILVTDGQIRDLDGGPRGSRAYNMSSNGGAVVGWWGTVGENQRSISTACVWRESSVELLGTLPGYYDSIADCISDDGSIITGICSTRNGQPAPEDDFVWTQATGMVGFTEYAARLGYELLPNYTYSDVAVTRDGSMIYGRFQFRGDPFRSGTFTIAIPAPSTLLAAACGPAMARWRRRE